MTDNSTTYNRTIVKSVLINRIIIVLAWVGIFIAGFLTYAHYSNMIPPCGSAGAGCEKVQTSQYSTLFGLPVSLMGLGGYLAILALAILRSTAVGANWKRLTNLGLIVAGIGTGVSLVYMYISLGILSAMCIWCLASATTMASLFITHGFLANSTEPEDVEGKRKIDFLPIGVGAVLAIGLFGYNLNGLKASLGMNVNFDNVSVETIKPRIEKIQGNADAKVMVVEFADVNCPACRLAHPMVKKVIEAGGPNLAYAFRTLPLFMLQGHETSVAAAIIAEYAADHNKYYEFLNAAFSKENDEAIKSNEGLIRIAKDVGLDEDEVRRIVNDQDDAVFDKAAEDFAAANALQITSTPTFIILAEGHKPKAVGANLLASTLDSEPYRTLLSQ